MTTPDAQPQPTPGQAPAQAPYVPPQPGQAPPAPFAPPQPAKKKNPALRIVILLVIVAVVGGVTWWATRDDAKNANVGDCLHQTGPNDLAIVKCDSADANFVVLGKVGDKSSTDIDLPNNTICDQWPDTTAEYWWGTQGEKGSVLCIKENKK